MYYLFREIFYRDQWSGEGWNMMCEVGVVSWSRGSFDIKTRDTERSSTKERDFW